MDNKNINNEISSLKKKISNPDSNSNLKIAKDAVVSKKTSNHNIRDFPIMIDDSHKYIKKLYFIRNCKTDDEYIKCQIEFFTLFKENDKFCLLLNIGHGDTDMTPNIDYIIQMINMFKKVQTSIESKIICSAFVIENPIFEWVLKFGLKIYKPIKPMYVFNNIDKGIEKLNCEIKKVLSKK